MSGSEWSPGRRVHVRRGMPGRWVGPRVGGGCPGCETGTSNGTYRSRKICCHTCVRNKAMVHTSSTRTQVGPAYTYRATARLGMLHAIRRRGIIIVLVLVIGEN
eukprot:scaffold16036_cov58-Phaeocystis_antarctica.AAC.5